MRLAALKTVGVFALIGAVLGHVVATLIAPGLIAWYVTPGGTGTGQVICNTAEMARDIFSRLIRAQLIGAGVGAAAFIVLGIVVLRSRARRAAAAASPASPSASPPRPPG